MIGYSLTVFLPKQLGWNFIEEDSLTRSEQFNRVDTAIFGGTMFTTIRASLAEQRRQENIRTLQSGVSECLCAKEPIPKDDDNDTEMTRKEDQICPKQTFRPEAVERQNNVNAMGDFKRVFFPNPEVVNTNNTDVLNSGAASRWLFGSANAKVGVSFSILSNILRISIPKQNLPIKYLQTYCFHKRRDLRTGNSSAVRTLILHSASSSFYCLTLLRFRFWPL